MEWPLKHESTGKFQTTPTAKQIWKAALEAVLRLEGDSAPSPQLDDRVEELLEQIDECTNWRKQYRTILGEFGSIFVNLTSEQVLVVAEAGIKALHETMVFRIDNDRVIAAKEAFEQADEASGWTTRTIHGSKDDSDGAFYLPSPLDPNVRLVGEDAVSQIQAWVDYGCAEPSAALHASKVFLGQSDFLQDIISDKVFVILGVTSSLGPTKPLLRQKGAHVLGVARNGTKLEQLIEWVEQEGSPGATLQIPEGGADILKDGPRVARWIVENLPADRKNIVICSLVYMDGEAHVRASAAMDLISEYVTKYCDANGKRVSLSYLGTPTSVCVVPPDAARDAHHRFENRPFWQRAFQATTRTLKPWDFDGRPRSVLNGLATLQGPNYALAKSIQLWRSMLAACRDNRVVSAPLAPATRSESVISYSSAATYLEGIQHVEPMVSFDVEQTSYLMAAILLSQLTAQLRPKLEHPMQITWDGAVHGGIWRCPYEPESTGAMAYVVGKTATPSRFVPPGSVAKVDVKGEQ